MNAVGCRSGPDGMVMTDSAEKRMPADGELPLTVVVLTFNEEVNLERCLQSVAGWCRDIIVVDSYSTDRTLEIARRYTEKIFQHAYAGHAQQWHWALTQVPLEQPWILAMDADFVASAELRQQISTALAGGSAEVAGYYVRHRQIFRGRFIRWGTIYPRYWLRLFRRGQGYVDQHDLVDLHFYVRGGVGRLEADVIEDNHKERDIGFWVNKQVKFAGRQAEEEFRRQTDQVSFPVQPALLGTPDQRTLWLKSWWYRLPLFVRPFLYFGYRYFLRLGFLDGREGFIYHFTQALLYRLLVDIELSDLRAAAAQRNKSV